MLDFLRRIELFIESIYFMACLLLIIYSLPVYLVERHHFGFISAKTLVNLESNPYKHSHPQNEGNYLHSKTFLLSVFRVALVLKVGLIHLEDSLVGWLTCLSHFQHLPGSHLLEKEMDPHC